LKVSSLFAVPEEHIFLMAASLGPDSGYGVVWRRPETKDQDDGWDTLFGYELLQHA
jgi:hypothetical protein